MSGGAAEAEAGSRRLPPEVKHRLLDGRISYWRFAEDAGEETFRLAFDLFDEVIHRDSVTRLVIRVEMKDSFLGRAIQRIWLRTGEILDTAGVEKWGVVVSDPLKIPTLRFLVRGGHDGQRRYAQLVSGCEEEVLRWARE